MIAQDIDGVSRKIHNEGIRVVSYVRFLTFEESALGLELRLKSLMKP